MAISRRKRVSKKPKTTRLYSEDLRYIEKEITERTRKDNDFADIASAIRHYVHVGIVAELQTDKLVNTLDNAVVKRSQKNAVREELKPLTDNLKNLNDTIRDLMGENKSYFGHLIESSKVVQDVLKQLIESSKVVQDVLKQRLESFENVMEKVLTTMQKGSGTERESLRNIIVLRSLFYLFLIGHKLGRMESGADDIKNWQLVVVNAHKQANLLSDEELQLMEGGKISEKLIMDFTAELFEESKRQLHSE